MIDGRIVRADCKIHPDIIETGCDEAYNGQEPCGGTGSTPGFAEPLGESVRGAQGSQGDKTKMDEKNLVNLQKRMSSETIELPTESRTRGFTIWGI